MKNKFILIIAIIQIFLMASLSFADSYQISKLNNIETQTQISKTKDFNLIKKNLGILIGLLSINQIGIVSAEPAMGCCVQMPNGAQCQPILAAIGNSQCPGNYFGTPCELTPQCQPGCCVSKSEGNCNTNTPKKLCETNSDGTTNNDGVWTNDATCNLPECQKGCCIVFNQANFETQNECKKRAELYGVTVDFRQVSNELECLSIPSSEFEGACLTDSGSIGYTKNCQFVTQSICKQTPTSKFYDGVLCSYFENETGCEKEKTVSCVDGKDGIYWFDSCGNKENIYEGNNQNEKDNSWNDGKVKKDDICTSVEGSENPNPNCGNCNRALGSICQPVEKNSDEHINGFLYTCKNLNCNVKDTEDAKWLGKDTALNGERWCVYDGPIGNKTSVYGVYEFASDTVGSRHWVRYCQEGQVKVEPCQDYRAEVCQQITIEDKSKTSKTFSTASCVPNQADACIEYNTEKDKTADLCSANNQCMLKKVKVDNDFNFNLCVPKYPKGGNETIGQTFCTMANMKCPVVWVKNEKSVWECKKNCDCLSGEFAQRMNDLCVSLGDCGTYVNWAGTATKNIGTTDSNKVVLKDFENFYNGKKSDITGYDGNKGDSLTDKKSIYAQRVSPIDLGSWIGGRKKDTSTSPDEKSAGDKAAFEWAGGITGGLGGAALGATFLWGGQMAFGGGITTLLVHSGETLVVSGTGSSLGGLSWIGTFVGPFASAAIGAAIFAVLGSMLAQGMGLTGDGAKALMWGSGIFGAGVGILVYQGLVQGTSWIALGFGGWIPGVGWGLALAGAILATYVLASGWGKTEIKQVGFSCQSWQAPPTKTDAQCEICNQDKLKPCSDYRCQSLGQACKLLNSDTDQPVCIWDNKADVNPAYIIPDQVWNVSAQMNITGKSNVYEFSNYNGVGDSEINLKKINGDGCIQEFFPVVFTLNTTKQKIGSKEYFDTRKAAQCKYSFNKRISPMPLDNLPEDWQYPLEQNLYTFTHTFVVYMPSLSSLSAEQVEQSQTSLAEKYANLTIFVSCQDQNGNFNVNEFKINFCVNNGPDTTAVDNSLTTFSPMTGSYVKLNQTTQNLTMWVNEPANCNWDSKPETTFDNMANNFTCDYNLFQQDGLLGWKCTTMLTGINQTLENKFYIKCRDQPLEQDQTKRNTNAEDFVYELKTSQAELKIDKISPIGDVKINGAVQATVDLEVWTSGGAHGDGTSSCSYKWVNTYVPFIQTNSSYHKQPQLTLLAGTWNIPIKCVDDGGNIVENETNFNVLIDNKSPQIVRIYDSSGMLNLITDEDAACYYNNFNRCNPFNEANATSMTSAAGGFSTQHSITWDVSKIYFIKCKDKFFTWNSDCTVVKPVN